MLQKILSNFLAPKIGYFTNQSAFGAEGSYNFLSIHKKYKIKKLFFPEHGLFSELQDQVSGSNLKYNFQDLELINLYGDSEDTLVPKIQELEDLNILFIDIKDVGSRYYTYLTTAFYILNRIHELKQEIFVLIVDYPNPIGNKMEGSPLQNDYTSFVGVETVLHRHGLTTGNLLKYYILEFKLNIKYQIHKPEVIFSNYSSYWIPPSPNIPTVETCLVYVGQCLLEGTNLSEGRGTTKPFEFFGSNYLEIFREDLYSELNKYNEDSFILKPIRFIPSFHKFKNQITSGFHLIITDKEKFHSLFFALYLIKILKKYYKNEFHFLDGVYEFRSTKKAIKLLVGDSFLLEYLEGFHREIDLKEYLTREELKWKTKIQDLKIDF